ncbi:MAG: hypothetical protein QXF83_03215, partial [Candidatus Bathyarchaeia archaeon]
MRFLKKQKMNLILLLILSFHIYNIRNELFYNKLDESWYINVQERFSSLKQGNLSVENLIF